MNRPYTSHHQEERYLPKNDEAMVVDVYKNRSNIVVKSSELLDFTLAALSSNSSLGNLTLATNALFQPNVYKQHTAKIVSQQAAEQAFKGMNSVRPEAPVKHNADLTPQERYNKTIVDTVGPKQGAVSTAPLNELDAREAVNRAHQSQELPGDAEIQAGINKLNVYANEQSSAGANA